MCIFDEAGTIAILSFLRPSCAFGTKFSGVEDSKVWFACEIC